MAESGYGCEFGDCVTSVNHLITTLNPASTVSLCDEHEAPGLIPLLAAVLGVDPMRFYAAVERFVAAEAKRAAKELEAAQAAERQEQEEEPPTPDGPPYTDAIDDRDGMSEEAGSPRGPWEEAL